jgi:hypothetical protein
VILDPASAAIGKAAVGTALKPLVDFIRRQFSRRGSEFSNFSDLAGIDQELSEAFNVLAHESPTPSAFLSNTIKGLLSQRPSVFDDHEARHFVSDERIIALGKSATRKIFADQDMSGERAAARDIYTELFGDQGAFGEQIFDDAVAFSVASVAACLDPQARVLLQSLNDLRSDTAEYYQQLSDRLDRIADRPATDEGPFQVGSKVYGVPNATRELLPRPALVEHISGHLLGPGTVEAGNIILVGEGGSGKSTVAAMLARRSEVVDAFADGVFWLSLGQHPDIPAYQGVWLNFVTARRLAYPSSAAATAALSAYFAERQALLILDDVWNQSDLSPFLVGGPKCRTLITTRERKLDSYGTVIRMQALLPSEAVQLIRIRSKCDFEDDEKLRELATGLDHLPLALELAAYQLSAGLSPADLILALNDEIELLETLSVPGHEHELDSQISRNQSLDACLNLSVRRLEEHQAGDLACLSIIRPGAGFAPAAAAHITGRDVADIARTMRLLWSMSLLERDERGNDSARYRMHAVIRAKALRMLIERNSERNAAEAQAEAVAAYLRRCNSRYPNDWHLVEDDGHTLENLTYYFLRCSDEASMLSLLATRGQADGPTPNAWHQMRIRRAEEELFAAEIAQIHEHCVGRKTFDPEILDLFVRAHIARASLADMNRDIDLRLSLALLKAGLWTEGQVASQAKRRFNLTDMMEAARHLPEPLRTQTLAYATARVALVRPSAAIAAGLVRVAEVFDMPQRGKIGDAAARLISFSLDAEEASAAAPSSAKLGFLRVALLFRERLGDAALPEGPLWVDRFLSRLEHSTKLTWSGEMRFAGLKGDTFGETVAAAETLLSLASETDEGVRARALATASRLLEDELAGLPAYSALRFKLLLRLRADPSAVREEARTALTVNDDRYAAVCEQALLKNERLSVFAQQLSDLYADDADFVSEIVTATYPNRLALAFLETILSTDLDRRDGALARIGGAYAGIIRQLVERGMIAATAAGEFHLSEDHYRIIAMLVRSGLGHESVTPASAFNDLRRVAGDFDRLRLFEAVLPCLGTLNLDAAEKLCALFRHVESASIAWLAIGTRVEDADRDTILKRAVSLLSEHFDATRALRALSRYISSYRGSHAMELAKSAAALAAGIGDADAMRAAFTRASIAMPAIQRRLRVKAGLWDWTDTMPTHAEIDPIPWSKSLTIPAFWVLPPGVPDEQFNDFVFDHLSKVEEDDTRSRHCERLADIAQEFSMRGMSRHANEIAEAIFDSAAMYR